MCHFQPISLQGVQRHAARPERLDSRDAQEQPAQGSPVNFFAQWRPFKPQVLLLVTTSVWSCNGHHELLAQPSVARLSMRERARLLQDFELGFWLAWITTKS